MPSSTGARSAARRAPVTTSTPLRSAPRVLRIWLAPYEDSEGDLRDQTHIYVTVDRGSWQIEHTRRAIQDRFAPIRAVVPAAPAAGAPGATRGSEVGTPAPQNATLPEVTPPVGVPGGSMQMGVR
jgi:conjugal transfer pilus assembly protein TraV